MPPADSSERRVLVVLHENQLGGASRAVLRCVPGLESRGWEFTFSAPRGSDLAAALRNEGRAVVEIERPVAYSLAALRLPPGIGPRLRALPRFARELRGLLGDRRPALVHANSHTTLADAWLARRHGTPVVFHVHEMFGDGIKWDLGRRVAFRASGEVVAVSQACANALATGARRARVVYNGVPLRPPPVRDGDGDVITVGCVAALSRRKGIDLYVEAARVAREREPRLRFELVGAATDPLDAEWAEALRREFGPAGIVHHEHADVPECLGRWDVFALASRRDPFPLSSLEAMAAALPVVAPAVDGIAEQVRPDTGVLVEPESAAALADAFVAIARVPGPERRRLGEAGRARVEGEFTIEAQVDGLDAAYRAALGGR